MEITRQQLRRIIREIYVGEEKWDAYQGYREPARSPEEYAREEYKVGSLVRLVDFRGDGWGGDYEKTVGDEVGTIIDVDDSEDGPIQYVVNWPAGEPTMVSADELEIINERAVKITKSRLRRIIREGLLAESMQRYAGIYLATDKEWYLDLASNEYGDHYDATTYGPFYDERDAEDYVKDNFSNPGGLDVDDSGTQPPPTRSPNGDPVQKPQSSMEQRFSRPVGYGGGRW